MKVPRLCSKVPLKFQVSDRTLFSISVSVVMRNGFSFENMSALHDPEPPVDKPHPGSSGFLIRSLPIELSVTTFKKFGGYLRYIPYKYPRYFAEVDQSFEKFTGKFSGKSRSTIRRKIRKFDDHCGGEMKFRSYRSAHEIGEFQSCARQVSELTYQERLMDAGLPNTADFNREMGERAKKGDVRAYVLFHGDKPVTYLYLEIENKIALYRFLGFDPDYRRWSVGTILHWFALEDLCNDQDVNRLDFTEGAGTQKEFFSSGSAYCADVFFIRKSILMKLLLRSHFHFNRAVECLGDYLEHIGLKTKIKRIMRFGFGSS